LWLTERPVFARGAGAGNSHFPREHDDGAECGKTGD